MHEDLNCSTLAGTRGCEWGLPTSDKGRKILLTTDQTIKNLPNTDRKNINQLPTWADIINICLQKKEHFAFFSGR